MLPKISSLAFLAIILLVAPLEAADSLSRWLCSGEIRLNGDNNYKAFFLDEPVYRYAARDLSDLRIVDENGTFVPYLIQSGLATKEVTENIYHSMLQKTFLKRNSLYLDFAVVLPERNTDPIGTVLRFQLPKAEFLKEIDVYGSYDGKTWEYIVRDQLYMVRNLIKDEIQLGQPEKYGFYRIIVLNNPERLKINGLDLIDRNTVANWSDFERETKLKYELKHGPDYSMLTIKNPDRLKIKRILVNAEGNFRRTYQITRGSGDEAVIKTGEIYNFRFKDYTVTKTDIDLSDRPDSNSTLCLKITNYDDPPLKINEITIGYYIDKVIFEDTGSRSYRLYFGNLKADKPRYDMEYFQAYLEKETQDLVKVVNYKVKSSARTSEENNPTNRLKFNIIIGIVAVILIIFVVKKLNTAIN
jgi:hypothetical protein